MDRPLGTATWTDPGDVLLRHQFTPGAFWLGRSPTEDARAIGYSDDRHICLISGTRGGKGTTSIINNLALWPGSVVVIDPKGENATITACRRGPGSTFCEGMGQAVYVLDPFNAAQVPDALRGQFNPMDALDPQGEETVDEAAVIADALIVISEGEAKYWDESGRSMLKGLILHVLTADEFEGERNLLTVRRLIMRGDDKKVELLKEMGESNIPSAHELLWEGVRLNSHLHGTIADIGSSFANMLQSAPKQYESVRQVVDRNTEFMDSPGMRRCLTASSFRLSDLKTKKTGVSLYLSLPQRYMNTHFRWLRMMIGLTVAEMEATPGKPATGHRILFCLDEFAGLKRMESIETSVAQIAGFGVKLMFVVQSLEQLKATYKDKWETFLSSCGLKIFFGVEDYFTREYVSKFIGEQEIIKNLNTTSQAKNSQTGRTHTDSHQVGSAVNEQTTFSTSDAFTHSTQENTSIQQGKNTGRSGGSQWSVNLGRQSNSGGNWKPGLFFKNDEQRNKSSGGSLGGTYGRQKGWNEGEQQSTTRGHGSSEGHTRTGGMSIASGMTLQESTGSSDSLTHTEGFTDTRGTNESAYKRRLLTEDELGSFFKRITDKYHAAYPGFALVLVSGEQPIFLRKANYFEDHQFIRRYDPHPDHEHYPLVEQSVSLDGPSDSSLVELSGTSTHAFSITRWLISPGEYITAGAPVAEVAGQAYGDRTVTIHTPVGGWVHDIPDLTHQSTAVITPQLTDRPLVVLNTYDGVTVPPRTLVMFPDAFINALMQSKISVEEAKITHLQQSYLQISTELNQLSRSWHSVHAQSESNAASKRILFWVKAYGWFLYLMGLFGKKRPWWDGLLFIALIIGECVAYTWRRKEESLTSELAENNAKQAALNLRRDEIAAQLPPEKIPAVN